MIATAVTLFVASVGGLLTASVQYGRTRPRVDEFHKSLEAYHRRRIDNVLASASGNPASTNLRDKVLALVEDRDFKRALWNVKPTGYLRGAICFAVSGSLALLAIMLDLFDFPGVALAQGIALPVIVIGAAFVVNDIWYYSHVEALAASDQSK